MKWTALHLFSFKDLISCAIVLTFMVTIGFYLYKNSDGLLELIKVLITPVIWVVSIYGGTEGLELIKGKLENSDYLNLPNKEKVE